MAQVSGYIVAAMTVEQFMKARAQDMLPDEETERVFGMSGERGRILYGAFNTLFMRGRLSRTMLEQALTHSPTSYPEYIQLWIRSLHPMERSHYTQQLCNSKFKGIEWDERMYRSLSASRGGCDEHVDLYCEPPVPFGDNRHNQLQGYAINISSIFHQLLSYGAFFDGEAGDPHAKLEECNDSLETEDFSPFGIKGRTDLNFVDSSEGRVDTMSDSEVMLRTWKILYSAERLSVTELECSIIKSPSQVHALMIRGIVLAKMFKDRQGNLPIVVRRGIDILIRAKALLDEKGPDLFGTLQVPAQFGLSQNNGTSCDHCDGILEKQTRCSRCKVAFYCSTGCQRNDWKRHKPLCERYEALPTPVD